MLTIDAYASGFEGTVECGRGVVVRTKKFLCRWSVLGCVGSPSRHEAGTQTQYMAEHMHPQCSRRSALRYRRIIRGVKRKGGRSMAKYTAVTWTL